MNEIKSLNEVVDFESVAQNLADLLSDPANLDISIHFPGTVKRYTGDLPLVASNLEETAAACARGKREQFLVFTGQKAVGMAIITNQIDSPGEVPAGWPNLSGFILNPYRSQRLGSLSIEHRLRVVDKRFGGHAWTYVRKGNISAERMVIGAGLVRTDVVVPGQEDQHVYVY